jgi:hypothetical protein
MALWALWIGLFQQSGQMPSWLLHRSAGGAPPRVAVKPVFSPHRLYHRRIGKNRF